jgi:hypothetical protein
MSSSKADALLSVKDRTSRSDSRHQHQQNHQRQPNRQRKQNARHVESEFPVTSQVASVCGADHGCRPCNPPRRRDVAKNWRVRGIVGFCLIKQSSADPIVYPHQSNRSRAASDLPKGPVPSGRSSLITRCNRVRSSEPRTEVFPLSLFLRRDAQPQDEDRPFKRSCRGTSLSLPHSH